MSYLKTTPLMHSGTSRSLSNTTIVRVVAALGVFFKDQFETQQFGQPPRNIMEPSYMCRWAKAAKPIFLRTADEPRSGLMGHFFFVLGQAPFCPKRFVFRAWRSKVCSHVGPARCSLLTSTGSRRSSSPSDARAATASTLGVTSTSDK